MLLDLLFSGKSPHLEKKKRRRGPQPQSEILRPETGGPHTTYLEGFQRHTLHPGGQQ